MEKDFWLERWQKSEIGFHQSDVNPLLVAYINQLSLNPGSRIFLPLCGKTLDIGWLLSQGYCVTGAELSELAVNQLFDHLHLQPNISRVEKFSLYSAQDIDIFVGDIFDLSPYQLDRVDAVYDRAALVALPPQTRRKYTSHLMDICNYAPQLLLNYEYDQSLMAGPPFSISDEEIQEYYSENYHIERLFRREVDGGLKGKCPAEEKVWLLSQLPE